MDYDVAEQNVAVYGDDGHYRNQYEKDYQHDEDYSEPSQRHPRQQNQHHRGGVYDNIDDSSAGHELKRPNDESSAGKLFVGGIAWETSEESFTRYFSKYGEITDSVIMMDKITGRPRGFGFVTFSDLEVANKVLQEDHVIDGRAVEVKRTVPREDMQTKGVLRTKKIFVGGLSLSLTEDDLKEYFSSYGNIMEHQIMLDHKTGRSRGFGFVTFENEDAVERVFSEGRMHELGGKKVEIKKAEPKRPGFDHGNESRIRRGNTGSKSYGVFGGEAVDFGGGYGEKMGRGYGGGYSGYGGYSNYSGNYGGGSTGFYGGYGYGFGFGGPMYGGAGYGGGNYGDPSGYGFGGGYSGSKPYGGSGYDGGKGYGGAGGATGYGGGRGYGSGAGGGIGNMGRGSKGYGNGGAPAGRFHPYRK